MNKFPQLGLKNFDNIEFLKKVSEKVGYGCQPHHLVFLSITLLGGLLVLNVASIFLSSLIGFLYPAYMSFKALETKGDDDDK